MTYPSDLNRKNVSVSIEQYDRLTYYGVKNESYSEVIRHIIDYAVSKGLSKESLSKFVADQHASHK